MKLYFKLPVVDFPLDASAELISGLVILSIYANDDQDVQVAMLEIQQMMYTNEPEVDPLMHGGSVSRRAHTTTKRVNASRNVVTPREDITTKQQITHECCQELIHRCACSRYICVMVYITQTMLTCPRSFKIPYEGRARKPSRRLSVRL